MNACSKGDCDAVQFMLNDELSPSTIKEGFRAACNSYHILVADLLLEKLDPSLVDNNELIWTYTRNCGYGNLDTIKTLLERFGHAFALVLPATGITLCCYNEDMELADIFLDECGSRVCGLLLERSCCSGDLAVITTILDSYGDVVSPKIPSLFIYACWRGDVELAELFMERCDSMIQPSDTMIAFNAACEEGQNEIVKMLVTKYPSVLRFEHNEDYTFNAHKVCHGHPYMTSELLNRMFGTRLETFPPGPFLPGPERIYSAFYQWGREDRPVIPHSVLDDVVKRYVPSS